MTELELNRAIRALVRLCTGIADKDVRPANQDAPAKGNFATVLIMDSMAAGHDDDTWADVAGDPDDKVRETLRGQRTSVASIQFFREGARDLAEKFRTRVALHDALYALQESGIGFISVTPVRNLSAVVNSAWEDRAQLDMVFSYISTETVDIPSFGSFPITVQTVPVEAQPPVNQSSEVFEP